MVNERHASLQASRIFSRLLRQSFLAKLTLFPSQAIMVGSMSHRILVLPTQYNFGTLGSTHDLSASCEGQNSRVQCRRMLPSEIATI